MASTVLRVRDRCTVASLDFSKTPRFNDCEVYVKLEGKRAKLLVVREDEQGNGELLWWQWVPVYQGEK